MRVIREIEVAGKKVQVRELTVGEIRAWMAGVSSAPADVVDVVLFEELTLSDLGLMTDLSSSDIDALAPSELADVLAAVQEVNQRFFGMRVRLAELGKRALETPGS